MGKTLISFDQAMSLLGVSARELSDLVITGRLRAVSVDRLMKFHPQDLDRCRSGGPPLRRNSAAPAVAGTEMESSDILAKISELRSRAEEAVRERESTRTLLETPRTDHRTIEEQPADTGKRSGEPAALKERIEGLTAEKQALERQLADERAKSAQTAGGMEVSTDQLASARETPDAARSEADSLRADLEAERRTRTELEQKLREIKERLGIMTAERDLLAVEFKRAFGMLDEISTHLSDV